MRRPAVPENGGGGGEQPGAGRRERGVGEQDTCEAEQCGAVHGQGDEGGGSGRLEGALAAGGVDDVVAEPDRRGERDGLRPPPDRHVREVGEASLDRLRTR